MDELTREAGIEIPRLDAAKHLAVHVTVDAEHMPMVHRALLRQHRQIRLLRRVLVDVQLGHHLPVELAARIDKVLQLTQQESA